MCEWILAMSDQEALANVCSILNDGAGIADIAAKGLDELEFRNAEVTDLL